MRTLLSCFLLLLCNLPAQEPSATKIVATLADTRIKESSGLARSMRHPDIFWTINDSGSEPCVFAIDLQGRTRAKVRLPNAVNFDWEDLSSGLDEDQQPVLYIADIGDNFVVRPSVQVYRIPEPAISAEGKVVPETTSQAPTIWHINYPDGAHNAESLPVHPQTRRIHILTKSEDGKSALYAFPEHLVISKPVVLEKITNVPFIGHERIGKRVVDDRRATGAAFSADGCHLVVSTYSSLYEWSIPEGKTIAEALSKPPKRLVPDLLRQLEAVCYDADGKTLWITSEHLPTPLVKISRP